jgi:hypothetical protein
MTKTFEPWWGAHTAASEKSTDREQTPEPAWGQVTEMTRVIWFSHLWPVSLGSVGGRTDPIGKVKYSKCRVGTGLVACVRRLQGAAEPDCNTLALRSEFRCGK